jgi:hypothetical protein
MTDLTSTTASEVVLHDQRLDRLRALGRALDTAIQIPGTSYRIGLDPIIGLIPGVGDAAGALLSGYILMQAARYGVPKPMLVRMATNIGIETVVGVVPFLGDLFDAAYKANTRNLRLLEQHLREPRAARRSSRLFLLLVAVLLALLFAGAIALTVVLSRAIAQTF